MANRNGSPAGLEGKALDNWYRRSAEQVEEERELRRQQARDEFFGRGRWREAKRPPAPSPVRPLPPHTRAAPPVRGAPVGPGEPGGFFATYRQLPGGGYLPQYLPAPLNRVEPSNVGPTWFWLSDGQVVDAQEVERIYAEQQRRMLGIDEFAPAASVRSENRLKDGYVPLASQIERGRREEDPTCHPNGGWEHDPGFHKYSKRTRDYEAQVTRAPGLDYVVRNPDERAVKFDGCAVWDPSHPLLEAKGPGYDAVIDAGERYGFIKSIAKKPESQGQRQVGAARGRPIEWHAAERRALEFFERAMPPAASAGVRFVHTPPR